MKDDEKTDAKSIDFASVFFNGVIPLPFAQGAIELLQ